MGKIKSLKECFIELAMDSNDDYGKILYKCGFVKQELTMHGNQKNSESEKNDKATHHS